MFRRLVLVFVIVAVVPLKWIVLMTHTDLAKIIWLRLLFVEKNFEKRVKIK